MNDPITLQVNGQTRAYARDAQPKTVLELILSMTLDPAMVVAEVNGVVVGKRDFAAHVLRGGDTVELVRLVGGG